jgi:hypothetical protein
MTSYLSDDASTMFIERQVFDTLIAEIRAAVRDFIFWKKAQEGPAAQFQFFSGPEDLPTDPYWFQNADVQKFHEEINEHLTSKGFTLHLYHFQRDNEGLVFSISLPHFISLAGGDSDWFQFYIDVLPTDYWVASANWDGLGNDQTKWKCELI